MYLYYIQEEKKETTPGAAKEYTDAKQLTHKELNGKMTKFLIKSRVKVDKIPELKAKMFQMLWKGNGVKMGNKVATCKKEEATKDASTNA